VVENFINNSWSIQCQCPQCSAPVTLEETDRILACPFCKVKLFFSPGEYVRYCLCLPETEAFSDESLFIPYWRFKGMVFTCQGHEIKKEIVDATILALQKLPLSASLGLRPQAMQLKFVTPDIKGKFLAHDMSESNMLLQMEDRLKFPETTGTALELFHKACIGETMSMIYTPILIEKGAILDGILKRPLAALRPGDMDALSAYDQTLYQGMQFIPALCPNCGWNLDGERDSIIFGCSNCSSAWQVSGSGLKRVDFGVISGKGDNIIYLPFWRIKAQIDGVQLKSYADLVRLANLPKAIQKQWEDIRFSFWVPAFKVHPDLLLRIGRFMTVAQPQDDVADCLPKNPLHPVTLPATEAQECLKIVLADITVAKKRVFPLLKDIEVNPIETLLVYVPFTPDRDDLSYPQARLIIPRNALKYGRNL